MGRTGYDKILQAFAPEHFTVSRAMNNPPRHVTSRENLRMGDREILIP
jgi:hypothetical protein